MRNFFVSALFLLSFTCQLYCEENFSIDKYYRHIIKDAETGIYQKNEYIIFHVKNKFNSDNFSRTREKSKAHFEAQELVRKWCIDYSIQNAPKDITEENYAFVASILDKYWPEWRYSEWELRSPMRKLSDSTSGNSYVISWLFNKEDLIKSLPSAFTSVPSNEFKLSCLKKIAAKELKDKETKNEFYNFCGAIDLATEHKTANLKVNKEYNELDKEIDEYYKKSEYIKNLKHKQEQIAQLSSKKESSFVANKNIQSEVNKTVVTTTNIITTARPTYVTNTVMKAYGDGMCAKYIECSKQIPAVVEIVETKTIKVNYFQVELENVPVSEFEEIIFSKGEKVGKAAPQTELAKSAISAFSSEEIPTEEKQKMLENALRENPMDADLWNFYGRYLFLQKNYYQALISFRVAIRLNPKHEYALTNLVLVYTELEKTELAKGVFPIAWCYSNSDWTKKELLNVVNFFED